ncbi:hypothetical protein [Roseimicrobium sp. ORNL1]|uniref:hypothetical protein n=1 Tax=Roseimicrobium sp. ORNL1 TaxID=2711231 RepID=UPI0013E14F21|nr:hypothetical protein [Roseimicrobium sp. ORNL1]QIF02838.1 hypothetical protein G5S37_15350 [Roseimicrobium sp. ORNL1]
MAIVLEANYAKKLGLPGYSSHQYSISIRTELTDLSQVEAESARLYALLQSAVDKDIQEVGFIPDNNTYGMNANGQNHHGNGFHGQVNGNDRHNGSTNGTHQAKGFGDRWNCTDGQKGFIQRIVNENKLDKGEVEHLANQLFGAGVKQLNKMQASQLIEDLLVKVGKPAPRQTRWQQRPTQQAA